MDFGADLAVEGMNTFPVIAGHGSDRREMHRQAEDVNLSEAH